MPTQIRRRRILIAALAGAAVAALGITISSHAADGDSATELLTSAKTLAPLKIGVTYQASAFPLPLRLTATDSSWIGAQYKTTRFGRPAFGWAVVGRPPLDKPLGLVTIVTAFGATPSVASTVARLRRGGSGTTYKQPTRIRLAGYAGRQFDGHVWGKWGHVFIPFSPKTNGASPPDYIKLDKGETFRIIVLDVRQKTLVLILESLGLPADQFPAFLNSANELLKSLRFPA